MTSLPTPPPCPQCAHPTEPLVADGEDIWRCPKCSRRTYGTGNVDDDDQLPAFSEVDENGATICYLGTGDIDFEATAELAAQDGPDDEDEDGYTAEEWAALTPIERLADQALRRSRAIPETEQCPHCEGLTGELRYTPGGEQLWVPCRWCGSTGRRLSPGVLLVAIGPGASGKSTFAATVLVDAVVCLDSLRLEIGGDAGDQSVTPAAVARQNALLDEHLAAGRSVFLDSTNVEEHVRRDLVERARRHGRPIVALRFLPDLDTCLTRNAQRPPNRQVPPDTLRWQHRLTREATPDALLREGFTTVHHIEPTPTGATVSNDVLAPERIPDAVAVLRKAQEGDEEARRDLAEFFPEYEGLVMQTDHARYLEEAAHAGLVATHLLILEAGRWLASVDTYTSDLELPLASVALGDYASRTEAIREAVRAATDNGWALAPEHQWADFDCGGGEIHIPIHARPTAL